MIPCDSDATMSRATHGRGVLAQLTSLHIMAVLHSEGTST